MPAAVVLDFLRVLLTPQCVGAGVALTFFLMFRNELKEFIKRRGLRIKFPGGELSSPPQQKEPPKGKVEIVPADPTPTLPDEVKLSKEQATAVTEALRAERAKAYLWEYRYLNTFLVLKTQHVLDWLATLPERTTTGMFDSIWMPAIPDANERANIVGALQSHHLISIDAANLITVTPKGKEYLAWRGTVPPMPESVVAVLGK